MQVNVDGIGGIASEIKKAMRQLLEEVATGTEDIARANTPIKSGNARRNWRKQVSDRGFTVENRVPYIERLEAGASKQAPKGIVTPTLTQIKGKYV